MIRSRLKQRHDEAGVGLIGTSLGALMMMGLLFMALHTMLALQTRSTVSAAAWDAAREAALDPTIQSQDAQSRVNAMIGRLQPIVELSRSGDSVSVTVKASSPGLLPGVTSLDGARRVKRTAVVRIEKQR